MEVKQNKDINEEDPWAVFKDLTFLEKELEAFQQVLKEFEPSTSESCSIFFIDPHEFINHKSLNNLGNQNF